MDSQIKLNLDPQTKRKWMLRLGTKTRSHCTPHTGKPPLRTLGAHVRVSVNARNCLIVSEESGLREGPATQRPQLAEIENQSNFPHAKQ